MASKTVTRSINSFVSVESSAPFRPMRAELQLISKFVVSGCAFCKLQRNQLGFSDPSIILADVLGNTCLLVIGAFCISQFQLHPVPPPPPPGYCGAFARLISPGGGAFANFVLPWGRAFANPGSIPELFTRTRFPIRIYNYTEDFTGKEGKVAHLSRTGGCQGMFLILCVHFFIAYQARITDSDISSYRSDII